ncbi:hypothetical protein ACPPVV_11165 [Rhodanobacter sp. Col0626]|uniref:hypothetical protein n=1 Tax=Rhodanobacter sp. Col0626 TaxID=3415679 RepID=UPI003CF6A221
MASSQGQNVELFLASAHHALMPHRAMSAQHRPTTRTTGNEDTDKRGDGDRNENPVTEQDRPGQTDRDKKERKGDEEVEKQSDRDTETR